MEPPAKFLTPPTSLISVFSTEIRALHWVSPRQLDFSLLRRDAGVVKPHREGGLTEEVTMVALAKIIGMMSCGFLLCLGLSGHAASAANGMKADQSGERIGGQAGRGYEQEKWEHISATQAGERIGGQAGRGYEHVYRERIPTHAGERIGGQAGRGYEQANRVHIATQ